MATHCKLNFMSSEIQNELFHCSVCDLKIRYDYKGDKPPFFKKDIKLLESVYCIRDPFADDNLGGIILGGDCSVCRRSVCISQDCSTYNMKRYCICCAKNEHGSS